MKASFAAVAVVALGASSALASIGPKPTPHAQLAKRQQFPDGINVSAMLRNPESYIEGVSSALNDEEDGARNAARFASVTAQPQFTRSLRRELVSEFGTRSAEAAFDDYQEFLAGLAQRESQLSAAASARSAAAASSAAASTSSTPTILANAQAQNTIVAAEDTAAAPTSQSEGLDQVFQSTSGASSLVAANFAALAAAAAGALALAAL